MAVRLGHHAGRIEARSGEAPVWRCRNSDDGSRGTASMASGQAIQASCQSTATQKTYYFQLVGYGSRSGAQSGPHPKFAIRTILVRRTKVEHSVPGRLLVLFRGNSAVVTSVSECSSVRHICAIAQMHGARFRSPPPVAPVATTTSSTISGAFHPARCWYVNCIKIISQRRLRPVGSF
jgi:hypothetical protein